MTTKKFISVGLFFALVVSTFGTPTQAGLLDNLFGGFFNRYKKRAKPNIAEFVIRENQRSGEFDTLLTALTAVSADPNLPDLVDTLSNGGPFTVFAPTDEAFANAGLDPSNVASAFPLETLTDILLYHVTGGKKSAWRLLFERDIEMLNGDEADFRLSFFPFGFRINDSRIIDGSNRVSNGIVHVIDGVLLPPPDAAPASVLRVANIPEPATALLLCGLLVGCSGSRRFRKLTT